MWDQGAFLEKLRLTVDRFDREGAAQLCAELVAELHQGTVLTAGLARKALALLRRKAWFDQIEAVSDALLFTGQDDAQIRRQYAQALIDQNKLTAAVYVLEGLAERTAAADPQENAEARGLLGRVYKQLYVNAVNADPAAAGKAVNRRHLQQAVDTYLAVYRSAPDLHLWHGINATALAVRAARDGAPLPNGPDPSALAREILATLDARKQQGSLAYWDLATAAEASLALGDATAALLSIAQYVQNLDADAFELASTLRQLTEVWRLTIDSPPGSILLPLLQSHLLQRKGGRVDVAAGTMDETRQKTAEAAPVLERVLGKEGVVTLSWYKSGLDRASNVAKVLNPAGDGFGTGYLIRGGDLVPAYGDEILLLTNAHVASNDSAVQAKYGSLDPDDAEITFESCEAIGTQHFRVKQLLWTSPPDQLDATLLRLDPPVPPLATYPLAKRLPVADGVQKIYVIGHPGGRTLSISLNDNLLLDWDDRLIHYRSPTEGGSSGSPVFNQQWQLIGLHHAGGMSMKKLNGQEGTYAANEGIWIQRIIKALAEAEAGVGA